MLKAGIATAFERRDSAGHTVRRSFYKKKRLNCIYQSIIYYFKKKCAKVLDYYSKYGYNQTQNEIQVSYIKTALKICISVEIEHLKILL